MKEARNIFKIVVRSLKVIYRPRHKRENNIKMYKLIKEVRCDGGPCHGSGG
jgi:hypothetical protein